MYTMTAFQGKMYAIYTIKQKTTENADQINNTIN